MNKQEAIELIIKDQIEVMQRCIENLKDTQSRYGDSLMRRLKIEYYEELLKALKG